MDSVPKRARLFAALGEECRLEIAEELALSDRTPGELIEKLEISSALLAHHLDVLEDAGLVERFESTADRRKRFVRLVEQHRPLVESPSIPRRVVFVCRQNSARSQLAAAVWRRLVGASARSAGTEPAHEIHPMVFEVARRHGLALQSTTPQRFTASRGDGAMVITVCDQSHDDLARPLTRLHWSVPDPVKIGTRAAFERTLDELTRRISPLVRTHKTSEYHKGE
jgi:ArsR family transcriptional regulator, arsenate/arsenite/antimonite-responsive transcriptional repressor / arsenate reductase (thioredoxin)